MEIHVGDRVADVILLSREGNKIRLTIDGKLYEVDFTVQGKGRCSILHEGCSHNAELVHHEGGRTYDVHVDYSDYQVNIIDAHTKLCRMRNSMKEKQSSKIISLMPGKVVSVLVKKHAHLHAGNIVLVLEAMKMQTNYKVTADCMVKDILVNEGDTVPANQVMVTLEPLLSEE